MTRLQVDRVFADVSFPLFPFSHSKSGISYFGRFLSGQFLPYKGIIGPGMNKEQK